MKKEIIFSILIMLIMTFSSCSKDQQDEIIDETMNTCQSSLQCPSSGCEVGICDDGVCTFTTKSNCCGNGICESSENSCSCSEDCGSCSSDGLFFRECIDDECITSVDVSQIDDEVTYMDVNIESKAYLKLRFTYKMPAVVDGSNIFIDFILETLNEYNSLKINKISLEGEVDGELIYLGDNKNEFSLNTENKEYRVYFIPDFLKKSQSYDITSIDVKIWYELEDGNEEMISIRTPIKSMTVDDIDSTVTCPKSCDDNNKLTKDSCSQLTNNRCIHEYIDNVCGNYICEDNENSCSCPNDCAKCETYFEIEGVEGVCDLETNECNPTYTGIIKENPKVEDKVISGFSMQITYEYQNPTVDENSSIKMKVKLDSLSNGWDEIEFEQINVLSDDSLLGTYEISSDNKLNSVGDEEVFYTSWTYNGEMDVDLDISLKVYYIVTNDDGVETRGNFEKSLGEIRRIDFSNLI